MYKIIDNAQSEFHNIHMYQIVFLEEHIYKNLLHKLIFL